MASKYLIEVQYCRSLFEATQIHRETKPLHPDDLKALKTIADQSKFPDHLTALKVSASHNTVLQHVISYCRVKVLFLL